MDDMADETREDSHTYDLKLTGPDGQEVIVEVKATVGPEINDAIKGAAEALQAAQKSLERAGVHIAASKAAVERARAAERPA